MARYPAMVRRRIVELYGQDYSTAEIAEVFGASDSGVRTFGAGVPHPRGYGTNARVLGRYARTASAAQRAQFQQVFREYASNLYEARLGDYGGERVQVTGSVVRNANDVVVNTLISGGQLRQPETVRWRLARSGRAWKVQDVEVRGIWLAVVQQQDYVSTLDAAGGDLNILIDQLRGEVARQNGRR